MFPKEICYFRDYVKTHVPFSVGSLGHLSGITNRPLHGPGGRTGGVGPVQWWGLGLGHTHLRKFVVS